MKHGVFTISFDTELIWGRVHLKNYDAFIKRAERVHIILPKILNILDKYKVPATWALVGHIMLDECPPDRHKHKNIIRPKYTYLKRDWFEGDPGTNEKKSPAWYGKSLLEKIQSYHYHDIGCHTFAHFYWGEKGCSVKSAESDLREWVKIAKQNNVNAKSFVFPKNSVKYLPVLFKYGFTNYREKDDVWYKNFSGPIRGFAQIFDLFFSLYTDTTSPYISHKLVAIPGSFYFPSGRGIRRYIPGGIRAIKAKSGIDQAIKTASVFHMWTHPIDFTEDSEKLLSDFEEIIQYAAKLRDEGKIKIMDMNSLEKEYRRSIT